MSEKDGGPAFPGKSMGFVGIGPFGEATAQYRETPGMTLRDWYAGQALAGLLANSSFEDYRQSIDHLVPESKQTKAVAEICGSYADAMLAERAKE